MRIEYLYVSKLPIFSTGTLDTMLRSLAIGQLGRYGDPDMIAESHRKFDDHISEKDLIPADYKTAVFSAVLGNGDETHFDKLVEVRVEPLYAMHTTCRTVKFLHISQLPLYSFVVYVRYI